MAIDCLPGWETILNYQTWDAISVVLGSFKQKIATDPDYYITKWYTLALTGKYATIAREQIANFNQGSCVHDEFGIFVWARLSFCERKILKHQAVINHLGNNLQCLSTAALIVPATYFVNVMPTIDDHTSEQMQLYIDAYNTRKSTGVVLATLDDQPECANRMLDTHWIIYAHTEEGRKAINRLKETDAANSLNYSRVAHEKFVQELDRTSAKIIKDYLEVKREVCIPIISHNEFKQNFDHFCYLFCICQDKWNDCYLIAHDLRKSSRPPKLPSTNYHSTDQFMQLDRRNILSFVTSEHVNAVKNLREKFTPPSYTKKKLPKLTKEVDDIIAAEWNSWGGQIEDWRQAINAFDPKVPHAFVARCNELRIEIHSIKVIQQKVAETESKIRQVYAENSVYIPLVMLERHEFDGTKAALVELMKNYSERFDHQFETTTKLHAELMRLKKTLTFRRHFKNVLSTSYDQFRETASVAAMDKINFEGNDDKAYESDRKDIYIIVNEFVEKLNQFGRDAFELMY